MKTAARGPALRQTLGILSVSALDPWGPIDTDRPRAESLPARDLQDPSTLPPLPGFAESTFSPLAHEASRLCLAAQPGDGARTAVVLASLMGDATTADLASQRLVAGRVHNPLLFMQATPNAVLGYLSREFGITGQMFSLSTLDDPAAELLATADLLLEDPELDRVLVVAVEPAGNRRTAAAYRELAGDGRPPEPPGVDLAVAVLIARADGAGARGGPPVLIRSAEPASGPVVGPPSTVAVGHRGSGLLELAAAYERLQRDGGSRDLVLDPVTQSGPTAFSLTATTSRQPKEKIDAQ